MPEPVVLICGVYGIFNEVTGRVYVGASKDVLKRWKDHCYKLNSRRHATRRMQEEWLAGQTFSFVVLERTASLIQCELLWIAKFAHTYNTATHRVGCPGLVKTTDQIKAASRMSGLLKLGGAKHTQKHSQETRALLSFKATGRKTSKATKLKLSKAGKGKPKPESHKQKHKLIREAAWRDLSYRTSITEKIRIAFGTPGVKKKRSQASKANWADPVIRAKMCAAMRAAKKRKRCQTQ